MLQTEYRPSTFNEFIGSSAAIGGLQEAIARENFPRVYLFTGIPGSGKTTAAFLLRNYFKCSDMDTSYYNSANTRGIDTIREIAINSTLAPMHGKMRIYILDEVHQVSGAASEAMLLMLENPPTNTIFALCTSEPEKLKTSIKRRCFQVNLKPLSKKEITTVLNNILEKEEVTDISDRVLAEIADGCQESAGMAVNMLDAVIDVLDEEKQIEILIGVKGVGEAEGIEICRALMGGNWKEVRPLLVNFKGDAESLRYLILAYYTKVLLSKNRASYPHALDVINLFSESFMYSRVSGLVASCFMACQ